MAQSERSKYAAVSAAWINYQKLYLGRFGSQVTTDIPPQFADIFWIGYALGEERFAREEKNRAKSR